MGFDILPGFRKGIVVSQKCVIRMLDGSRYSPARTKSKAAGGAHPRAPAHGPDGEINSAILRSPQTPRPRAGAVAPSLLPASHDTPDPGEVARRRPTPPRPSSLRGRAPCPCRWASIIVDSAASYFVQSRAPRRPHAVHPSGPPLSGFSNPSRKWVSTPGSVFRALSNVASEPFRPCLCSGPPTVPFRPCSSLRPVGGKLPRFLSDTLDEKRSRGSPHYRRGVVTSGTRPRKGNRVTTIAWCAGPFCRQLYSRRLVGRSRNRAQQGVKSK